MNTEGATIREWAKANGYHVANRGRLAPAIHAAYRAANGDRERPSNAAHCTNCGRTWTALRDAHCTVCHRHFSTPRWFDMHRKGMGRSACLDPGTLTDRHNEPLFRLIDDAWGKVWVSAAERPADLFVTPDSITAEPILF